MCGIFGCINKNKSYLNRASFNFLGIANDSRGGDSCGIFIDGNYEIGVKENKLYSNFIHNSTVLPHATICKVALGHCRKASVGVINEETAQPVIIRNSEGKVDFVLIHNGTIHNWEELAKKYLKDVPAHFTDSYVMASIIYKHGFKVLGEYEGAAAFVMVDYRKNRDTPGVYLFKGESLANSYAKETSEERPLFVSLEHNGDVWFSSILSTLQAARYGEGDCYTIQENSLIKIKDGKLIILTTFDRSLKIQTPAYKYSGIVAFGKRNLNKYLTDFIKEASFGNATLHYRIAYTSDGTYKLADTILHGQKDVSIVGYVSSSYGCKTWWFYHGILVYNKEAFECLNRLAIHNSLTSSELIALYPEIVSHYSPIPMFSNLSNKVLLSTTPFVVKAATGDVLIPFCPEYYYFTFKKGVINNYRVLSFTEMEQKVLAFKKQIDEKEFLEADFFKFNEYIKEYLQ